MTGGLMAAQARSQRGFYAALATGSEDARLERWPGVQATIVPVRPWFTILNSVLFDDAEALAGALPAAQDAYRSAGARAWRVWAPADDRDAQELLTEAGYARSADACPQRMGAPIDALDLEPRRALDVDLTASWTEVARCNDRAYGVLDDFSLTAAFRTMDDPQSRLYAVRRDGEVVSALVARESEGDCWFWFVATAPQARGQGLAPELMRRALRDAGARGCTTTTLEATAMGEPVYAGMGYEELGRLAVLERIDA